MYYLQYLGSILTLKAALMAGGSINYMSPTVNTTSAAVVDYNVMNLYSAEDDILFHMSFRRGQNLVIFNTRPRNGPWGTEDRIPLQGYFTTGNDAKITINDQKGQYRVLFNGRMVHDFKKKIFAPATKIGYSVEYNNPSFAMFSNPIGVEVS